MAKRATYILKVKIDGPGVRPGSISIPDLVRLCEGVQSAVNRQAEAMKGGKSLRPGPNTQAVQEECTLELVGIKKGSTTLPFRLARPQQPLPLPEFASFGAEVVERVVTTVRKLGSDSTARSLDVEAGVLDSLKAIGEIFDRRTISRIELSLPLGANRRIVRATFDRGVRDRVLLKVRMPSEQEMTVEGVLEMADFKEPEHRCRVHPAVGQPVVCSFDKKQEETVYESLRKSVRLSGKARIGPNTHRVEEIQIRNIEIISPLAVGAKDFFLSRTISELAESQGVRPLADPRCLEGGWPVDESVDDFVALTYKERSA